LFLQQPESPPSKMRNRYRLTSAIIAVSAVVLLTLVPYELRASSFLINEQSTSSLGTASAGGAAQAEDVSSMFFNPAAIVILDYGEAQTDVHGLLLNGNFSNSGTRYNLPGTPVNGLSISGGNGGNIPVDKVILNQYLSQPIFRNTPFGDLTVGLGVSAPYGLETNYEGGWIGRYFALRTKLTTIDIQPTIAYRFGRLSVGIGLDIQYASERSTRAVDYGEIAALLVLAPFNQAVGNQLAAQLAAQGVPPAVIRQQVTQTVGTIQQAYAKAGFVPGGRDGITELSGHGWDLGFTVGAIFEYLKADENPFFQEGRVGFSFRSAINHNIPQGAQFRGVPMITAPGAPIQFPNPGILQNTFFSQDATLSLDLPEIYHFSIFQKFAHRFAVMGDIAWTRWSELYGSTAHFSSHLTPSGESVFNYRDELRFSAGFEWYASKALTLRLGFSYDRTPVRSPQFNNPTIPDADRFLLATGLQWAITRNLDFDFGYLHVFAKDPQINVTDILGHNLRGTASGSADIISAALTLKWGGPKEQPVTTPSAGKSTVGYPK
jgi:long-chain fatty acid transport protein